MLFSLLLVFTLNLVLARAQHVFPPLSAYYANQRVLLEDRIHLAWNYTETNITGEIHAKTNGWFGFGLSPNGGMHGSDVFVAWIDANGKMNFTDRRIMGREVIVDKKQSIRLLGGSRVDEFLVIKFFREINTCDEEDLVIESGTPKVIYAWNDVAPVLNSDISYHGPTNRGVSTVQLLSALNDPLKITAEDAIETYDFNVDAKVPNLETYYHCHMFKLPDKLLNNKRHLIRTVTKLTAGNENYVHHWLAYQCRPTFETEYLVNNPLPKPGHCFDEEFTNSDNPKNTWNSIRQHCEQVTLIWAIGGDLVADFPNGLGFPIGGADGEFKYFFIEMHFNNPELKSNIVDKSGFQLNVTPKLRPIEIGIFTNGAASSWSSIIIAPQQQAQKMKYHCRSNCLDGLTGNKDITIFATAPHTHIIGSAVTTTLIRNGKEIEYITKSNNYDFNYQQLNFLQKKVVLKKGDEILTTCTYKTVNKNTYTFGGTGTPQEMCLDFLFYYPRVKNTGACISYADDWENFFLELKSSGSITSSKDKFDYSTIAEDLKTLKTDATTINKVKSYFDNAKQGQYCFTNGKVDYSSSIRMNPAAIIEQDECEPPIMNGASTLGQHVLAYSFIGIISFFFF